jgi:hypothetical protein
MNFSEKPPSGRLAERISSAREVARLEIIEKAARSAVESQRTIHGLLSRIASQRPTPPDIEKQEEAAQELTRRETALAVAAHELEAARSAAEGE